MSKMRSEMTGESKQELRLLEMLTISREHNPLDTRIHLTTDPEQRRECLLSLRNHKLRNATEYILARTRHMDLSLEYGHDDCFGLSNGDYVVSNLKVEAFASTHSTKDVFEALLAFFSTQELSLTETLGLVTIHDEHEIETNVAMFVQWNERTDELERRHGIVVIDYVNQDDLYPYKSDDRIRQDVTGVFLVTTPEDGAAASLIRWGHIRLRRPQFVLNQEMQKLAREGIAKWGNVIPQVMRERLSARDRAVAVLQKKELGSGSGSSSPAPDDAPDSTPSTTSARKKRKPTYYVRKEEAAALTVQISELEAKLRSLEMAQRAQYDELARALLANAVLANDVKQNDITMAGLRGLMNKQSVQRKGNALETYIYLPEDPQQRRDVMWSMKDQKVFEGREFLDEYTRCLDATRSHRDIQMFDTEDGDYVYTQFDVTVFDEAASVKQAFDGLVQFFVNQEVSTTASLGVLTIRESDDCSEATVSQCRLLQALPCGTEIENNAIMYLLYEEDEEDPNSTYGMVVTDYVNEDAVYPYKPHERLREDVSAVGIIRRYPRPDGSLVVTMTRWAFVRLHAPRFDVPSGVLQSVKDTIARWGDIMPMVMREYCRLHSNFPSGVPTIV
ncbi:hypothetical protein ATCC90586_006445 [Pythium insidiosum]|nr:hypothetical protein ATCC90586_006445 [Pythium insidiosum]